MLSAGRLRYVNGLEIPHHLIKVCFSSVRACCIAALLIMNTDSLFYGRSLKGDPSSSISLNKGTLKNTLS